MELRTIWEYVRSTARLAQTQTAFFALSRSSKSLETRLETTFSRKLGTLPNRRRKSALQRAPWRRDGISTETRVWIRIRDISFGRVGCMDFGREKKRVPRMFGQDSPMARTHSSMRTAALQNTFEFESETRILAEIPRVEENGTSVAEAGRRQYLDDSRIWATDAKGIFFSAQYVSRSIERGAWISRFPFFETRLRAFFLKPKRDDRPSSLKESRETNTSLIHRLASAKRPARLNSILHTTEYSKIERRSRVPPLSPLSKAFSRA